MAKSERARRYLSPSSEHIGKLIESPVDALLDGAIDLGIISTEKGEELRDVITHQYSDLLEPSSQFPSPVVRLGSIARLVREEMVSYENLPIDIQFQQSRHPEFEVRALLDEEDGKKNRVVVMDGERSYLVTGHEMSQHHRIRLRIIDPMKPKEKPEVKRNRWVREVLQKGFVVVSKIEQAENNVSMTPGVTYEI